MPSVSASVFRGDELVWQQALGLADVEAGTAASADTQYRIGSITKTFTAVGILQLRDAGELSLDDPLTTYLPESAHGPTLGRMLAHSSGLQREPPGEIWETMQAPSREELLAGTADAEQVLDPGSWWHYSNLAFALLGEVVARAHGGTWEEALQANILDPLGLARTTPDAVDPAARGYFVEPYSDAVQARARARSRRRRRARQALVDDGRPRAVGSVPRGRRRPRPQGLDARGDGARARDGRPRGLEARLGDGARALPLRRPRLRRPRRRHARPPRGSRGQPQDQDRRGGAHEHGRRRLAGEARARPRRRGDRGAAGGGGGVADRRTPRRRRSSRCSAAGGWRARRWCSRGEAAGSRRSSSTALPDETPRSSRPTATTASAASRAASAASCCASCGTSDGSVEKLYFATYPLRREPSTF